MLNILIKFNNNSYNLQFPKNIIVSELKQKIRNKLGISINNKYLKSNNCVLKDLDSITNNLEIHLLTRKIGGGAPKQTEADSLSDARNYLNQYLKNNCSTGCDIDQSTKIKGQLILDPSCINNNFSTKASCVGSCSLKAIAESVAMAKQKTNTSAKDGAKANSKSYTGNIIEQEILNKCDSKKKIDQSFIIDEGASLIVRAPTNDGSGDSNCQVDFSKYADAKTECYLRAAIESVASTDQTTSTSAVGPKGPNPIVIGIIAVSAVVGLIAVVVLLIYLRGEGTYDKGALQRKKLSSS